MIVEERDKERPIKNMRWMRFNIFIANEPIKSATNDYSMMF
jgi:hypothetical protein